MNIEGRTIRLRAVEPGDVDLMYEWENDCDIWPVSGTTEPFSRHQLERFVASGHRRGALRRTTAADHRDAVEFQAGRGDRPVRIRPDPPPGRHRHPHLRTERPGTRLRLRRRGNPLPLCTRYAARASAVVQRRRRQRSEPAPVPQRGIHRDRRQTRLAMAARRLSRRGDAAKDIRLKQRTPSGFGIIMM